MDPWLSKDIYLRASDRFGTLGASHTKINVSIPTYFVFNIGGAYSVIASTATIFGGELIDFEIGIALSLISYFIPSRRFSILNDEIFDDKDDSKRNGSSGSRPIATSSYLCTGAIGGIQPTVID